jgi:hypothetical protein
LLLEPVEDAAERAGIEVVLCKGLVHAFGAPTDAPGIKGAMERNNGRLDRREVEVAESITGVADNVTKGLGGGGEGKEGRDGQMGRRLMQDKGV